MLGLYRQLKKRRISIRLIAAMILMAGSISTDGAPNPGSPQAPEQAAVPGPVGTARLWVTAFEKSHPVTDLRKEEVEILSGRQEQTISALTFNLPEPLNVGLVVDESGSRRAKLPGVEAELAREFFRKVVRKGDQAFIVTFNNNIYLLADLTDSQDTLDGALQKLAGIRPWGGTALYDAISQSCLQNGPNLSDHRALVVVTDGADNASHHGLPDAMESARKTGTALYFIDLARDTLDVPGVQVHQVYPGGRPHRVMGDLARGTGGTVYKIERKAEMEEAFDSLAEILRAQYALDFPPTAPLSGKKGEKVRVRCTRPGVKIIAPEEYKGQ